MSDNLPEVDDAYRSLCATADYFDGVQLAPTTLGGLTYPYPEGSFTPFVVNDRVLAAIDQLYVDDGSLAQALQERGARVNSLQVANRFLNSHLLNSQRNIWGLAGYATRGHECSVEGAGMSLLYQHLVRNAERVPSLVTDGGSSTGVLGLNGVLAKMYGVISMGFTPLQGLGSMSPRDHMVVHGLTYREREALVGLVPDVIVCVGGGEGAQRECAAALGYGSVALMLALRPYDSDCIANYWIQDEVIGPAAQEGRVLVCRETADISNYVDLALQISARTRLKSRYARQQKLSEALWGSTDAILA